VKRVLFVLPWFHTNLHYALTALVRHGVEPVLLVREGGRGGVDGVRIIEAPGPRLAFAEARRLVRAERPDLVVIRKTRGLARPVHLATLLQGVPAVGYDQRPILAPRPPLHGPRGLFKGRPRRRFTPVYGLPRPRRRADATAFYLPFPVASAPAGVARRWAPEGVVRILCVAKLAEARKNHRVLIRALERLADDVPVTLTLAGSSSLTIGAPDAELLAWLRAYAGTGALGARVTVLEDVPFDAMTELYARHDVCVLPSSREPLGTAPLEAMGQGCAALVSAECGSAWYVQGAAEAGLPCGEVFAPRDVDALAEALRRTVSPPDRLAALGANALAWVRREFGEDRFAERFLRMADQLGATSSRVDGRRGAEAGRPGSDDGGSLNRREAGG
jgi:glycosyltransferase involved in cell wall biosynthesis